MAAQHILLVYQKYNLQIKILFVFAAEHLAVVSVSPMTELQDELGLRKEPFVFLQI